MDVILSILNIVFGLIMAHVQFKYYKSNGTETWTWIKLLLGVMGLYWAGIYFAVTLARLNIIGPLDPVYFGRIFILPAITISLGLCAAGGLIRKNYK